jgi:hypothetical protein
VHAHQHIVRSGQVTDDERQVGLVAGLLGRRVGLVREAAELSVLGWQAGRGDADDVHDSSVAPHVQIEPQVVATIARFADLGFDGVEVFYASHTPEQTRIAYDAARAHDLLTTGSADFHGPGHEHFDRFRAFDLCGLEPVLGPLAR